MIRALRAALAALLLTSLFAFALSGEARAAELDPAGADGITLAARHEGFNAFCAAPAEPLPRDARAVCPLAARAPECDALVAACAKDPLDLERDFPNFDFRGGGTILGGFARVLVFTAIGLAIAAIAAFVAKAIAGARRDERAVRAPAPRVTVTPDPTGEALATRVEAEVLLARAAECAVRGELGRAASLYLAAALSALDRRGAIRIAKHHTHGEYVRACTEEGARGELRAIVREVDKAQFGHEPPTREAVAAVAARAAAIVRASGAVAMLALLVGLSACAGGSFGQDIGALEKAQNPAGDDLLREVLARQGAEVAYLGGSLATLPIPAPDKPPPFVVVDASRTPLEGETWAHLLRWVEAGGHLLLAGNVSDWPKSIGATPAIALSTELTFSVVAGDDAVSTSFTTYPASVALTEGFTGEATDFEIASTEDGVTYAAAVPVGQGIVVALAGDSLLTNVGMATPPNAAAVVALLADYGDGAPIRLTRTLDGVSPPTNPLSALLRAGLGLLLAHAAVATLLLMFAFGVRQARAAPAPPAPRRAFAEHVAATGALYARARLAPHALATYARFVDGRLRARMPRTMSDPGAFLARATGADPTRCADVWAAASSARTADRATGRELRTLAQLRALYAASEAHAGGKPDTVRRSP